MRLDDVTLDAQAILKPVVSRAPLQSSQYRPARHMWVLLDTPCIIGTAKQSPPHQDCVSQSGNLWGKTRTDARLPQTCAHLTRLEHTLTLNTGGRGGGEKVIWSGP